MTGCYLVHFERPYEHARHYIGWSSDIAHRVRRHRAGHGARLLQVVGEAGIGWDLVRVWPGATRGDERRLSATAGTDLCPVCTPGAGRGRWPVLDLSDGHRAVVDVDRERCTRCRRSVHLCLRPRVHWRHAPRRASALDRVLAQVAS